MSRHVLTDVNEVVEESAAGETSDLVTFSRPVCVPNVEIMDARPSRRLWVVYHSTYTVCTIFAQESRWTYRGSELRGGPEHLMVMEPGEVHVTKELSAPCTFSVALLDPGMVCDMAAEMGMSHAPHLDADRARDPRIWKLFAAFTRAMGDPAASTLRRQDLLAEAMSYLLLLGTENPPSALAAAGRSGVELARELLGDCPGRDVGLDELAAAAGLSRWQVSREFARIMGVPLREYQALRRVEYARCLLGAGLTSAEVAYMAGFSDQSHLNHRFREVMDITPGDYARHVGARH